MPINNMNPEGLVKEIKIKNKNQAYKRRWKVVCYPHIGQ